MSRYRHTIVIGGTGMLEAASIALAKQSEAMTSIARTDRSLNTLDEKIAALDCRHRTVSQDYNRLSSLRIAIAEAIASEGPADLLVAWIHDESGPVPLALCEAVSRPDRPCLLAHVMGSAAADPTRSLEEQITERSAFAGITYRPIVLGFHVGDEGDGDGGRSRWLTDAEISNGVLEAIESETVPFIVGQVRPWARRP